MENQEVIVVKMKYCRKKQWEWPKANTKGFGHMLLLFLSFAMYGSDEAGLRGIT